MWKKILSLTFFGSFIVATSSNVVSCNIPKQHQLSFNLKDWWSSWAFTTQNIYQGIAMGNRKFLVKESDGLFLSEDGNFEGFGYSLFQKFDKTPGHKSDPHKLETYLQLRYFVASIIYFNEQSYDSKLKNMKSISENFIFNYETWKGQPTEVINLNDCEKEKKLDETQQGDISEMILGTEMGSTLSAYFNVIISLKSPKETPDGKLQSKDGYYIKEEENYIKEIKIPMGVRFILSDW